MIRRARELGDVPILGALFRSADYQRAQTELVIIVTPHLVTPVSGAALALPIVLRIRRVEHDRAPRCGNAPERNSDRAATGEA